ncbi:MAG: transporter, partial [Gammaproteobacteria bacterium]|nr:transporter [Gammaproteobacteria bacterium]
MRTIRFGIVSAALAATMLATAASAAELPETHVTGVGLAGNTVASYKDEVPFWNEVIPSASGGKVSATFAPMEQLGVKGRQVLRMTKLGVV